MMAEASRGAKRKALVQYLDGIEEEDAPTMYRFQVLLPNAVSISLTLNNPGEEMPVRDLLRSVKRELNSAPVGGGKVREIHWDGNIFLTDILDQKITDKIKLSNFDTKSTNILRLQDEKGGFVGTFENMWDLTPQTDLVQELPAEYSTESALVDLTDNALQAVWSNGTGERKLIRITVDKEKIMIFDTGRGMDGSDQNSISKWGTLGSSNHRVFRQKGIGGKAPYLLPFFGMFGYGGTIASMHLGGIAIVNSKTKESGKVFTLHLSRDALLKKTLSKNSKPTWKTAGGVRDPSEEEMTLSPHKSFTQVEIYGLKKHLEVDRLLGFLKDIYFPYIQCDDDTQSMNTRNPVEFEVNDVNLAEVQEGEVTVTNMHSSNGPDFIFHLKFTEIKSASCQAHARLKCVYFPIIKGKESIDSILEKLRNDGYEMKENFENFSRVSIRRLGRLLPDARWGPLPFMEAKHRKGHKAEFFRRCCKRVKCFVETDAGFSPTLSKTDLAQHNHFTKALRNWGSKYFNNTSAEVEVEACDKDEKLLSYNQLEKQYYDWIKEMHDKYDVEMDGGDDEPTLIINPKCKERLGISNDVEVIRVHRSITRKGKTWRRGDHLKILPGATGRMKNTFYSLKTSLCTTLEYIVVEGLQGDICGEARLICRPIDYSAEQGCWLDEAGCTSPNIYIQESVSFPVSIIDNRMYKIMDDDSWNQMLKKRKEKAPAWIELISNSEVDALGLRGDLPYEGDVMAGYRPPHEIVAVLRPGNYTPSSTGLLEQKYIVKDELEMVMEVKQLSRSKDCPAKLVDKKVKKTSLHNDIHGLYVFPLREASWIFKKSGVYQFNFSVSCRDTSVIQKQTTITVCPDLNSRRCLFTGSSTNSDPVNIRLGCPVICLAVKSVDQYGNEIPFLDTSGITITLFDGDDVLAHVDDVEVELASDSLTMNVKDFLFKTSKLDILRPKYEAKLKLSSFDNKLSGIWPCKVKPGLPSTVVMDMSLFLEENLTPGRVIDNFLLEVFDQFSNHVEEGTILDIHVDGLCFLDKKISVQKVNGEGFIDLRGALRVLGGFGSEACISIFHNGKKIFLQIFQIAIRELKAVNVPESCPAGSFLDIIFEVSDSNGLIDESIDGPLHTLNITSNELPLAEGARYAIKHGSFKFNLSI
ncbi:structural maintenance of chromosomes flexible hinge domain-containing protein GMI1-like isoform X5 [Panicum virgatum]|uniref:structural maintenance of chromosomes flexible hinge domain-containing protein GMI1-like isoform X5 n=1 Tax=Panicum virgatum TaxID=38727 RepID=UPI0019D659B9|nr:structural maintenance of chromosomes flexible hinge domain-containing protein GMI1-like isoform X5 [Panicum virgatum]